MDWIKLRKQTNLGNNQRRSSISVHRILSGSWFKQSNYNSKNDRNSFSNRYHKYIHAVIGGIYISLSPSVAFAETIGGVSATANPIANSSGSVTNQAIQVLQGPYITNQYGDGISCQGSTLNVTPFVTGSGSMQKPYEPW